MTETRGLRLAAYEAKRVAQTCRTFANWPSLLADMGAARLGRGAEELTFVTRSGLHLHCPNVPGARLPLYEQFAHDCYGVAWLLGETDRPLYVLDVGAHIGAFATHLAHAGSRVNIECYEPSPESAKYLRRNVERNHMTSRIAVHECALAAETGSALLDDNSAGSVHNGLVRQEHRLVDGDDAPGSRTAIVVTTSTFEQALAKSLGPFDVVKMDCEGGEYDLVYGSSPDSWKSVNRVVMEYHPVQGESWDTLRSWFDDVGLNVVRQVSDYPGLGTAWLSRDGVAPLGAR